MPQFRDWVRAVYYGTACAAAFLMLAGWPVAGCLVLGLAELVAQRLRIRRLERAIVALHEEVEAVESIELSGREMRPILDDWARVQPNPWAAR